jgi:hypothetical protein
MGASQRINLMGGMELFDLVYAHKAKLDATKRLAAATTDKARLTAQQLHYAASQRVSQALTAVMRVGAASETTVVYAGGRAYVVELDPCGDDGLQYSVRPAKVISDGSDLAGAVEAITGVTLSLTRNSIVGATATLRKGQYER